jgi:anti-repressor protein
MRGQVFKTTKMPASLGIGMLAETKEFVSPLFSLLNDMRTDGHEISAPWAEATAMREAIQRADKAMEQITTLAFGARFEHASNSGN